ncbi:MULTISPECIES: pyridoxal-phosphate dependent enzyme [Streptomyces]|uniref:pyridoxal-phosphate dependent enzyme n=1 Tax=Streptomyces TaxID=1883 RepID=UPI00186B5579|nr:MULTISPECIES: pyridoxal-phosphate dependent enzyme [Streptomyces]
MPFVCSDCRDVVQDTEGPTEWGCARCDGSLRPTFDAYEKWDQAVLDIPGVGRYGRLLPVREPRRLASADAALRPLDSPHLARVLGVASVRLLPQTLNETGTFKDNEAVLLAAKCAEWGLDSVCMHSSGNTARAYQHYLEREGTRVTGFVPEASAYKCVTTELGRSSIVAVPGTMVSAADAAIAHSREHGAVRLAPSQWKIEGKAPLGLAIAEHCQDTTLIAVTIASGYGPLGMERGIRRARSAGLPAPAVHSYRLFQAADAGVLGAAIREGREEIAPGDMIAPEDAFEPTLQSTNPTRTLPLMRSHLAATGSRIDPVTPEEVERNAEVFLERCAELGVPLDYTLEKSAFICWAGLVGAAGRGELRPDERLTVVVSGSAPQEHGS